MSSSDQALGHLTYSLQGTPRSFVNLSSTGNSELERMVLRVQNETYVQVGYMRSGQ